ncbi:hypothetical protein MUP46_02420 [Patescibacteria group bacterium]|nr:hypothetical protein [Patescibacteria group bacterium]
MKKAFEGATQKYTPEQMAAILDKHQKLIELLVTGTFWWSLLIMSCVVILIALAIRTEVNYRKIEKRLGNVETYI